MIAVREDPERTEALGYDIRLISSSACSAPARSWPRFPESSTSPGGNFITPAVFGVHNNILPVIWVAVAGRKSLTATAIGTVALVALSQKLNEQGDFAFIALGGVLVLSMMLAPEGVVPRLVRAPAMARRRLRLRRGGEHSGGAPP